MNREPYIFKTTTVLAIVRESANAVSVQVTIPDDYSYIPGQHAIVRVTIGNARFVRQYSFSSAPSSNELWFTVVRTKDGIVSHWFNEQAVSGDEIEISYPYSGPFAQKIPREDICMIAGGSGIAPFMSILRENRLSEQPRHIRLLYSTRESTACFVSELTSPLEFEIILLHFSDTTRLTQLDIRRFVEKSSHVLICGSRDFTTTIEKSCRDNNPKANIIHEAFTL